MSKLKSENYGRQQMTADQVFRKIQRRQHFVTGDNHHRHCYCYRNHTK